MRDMQALRKYTRTLSREQDALAVCMSVYSDEDSRAWHAGIYGQDAVLRTCRRLLTNWHNVSLNISAAGIAISWERPDLFKAIRKAPLIDDLTYTKLELALGLPQHMRRPRRHVDLLGMFKADFSLPQTGPWIVVKKGKCAFLNPEEPAKTRYRVTHESALVWWEYLESEVN